MTSRQQSPSIQRSNARAQVRESELPDPQLRRKLNDVMVSIQRDAISPLGLQGAVVDYNLANWVSGAGYNYPDVRVPFTPRGVCVVYVEQENNPQQAFGSAIPIKWQPKAGGAQIISMAFPVSNRNYHCRLLVLK